MDHERLEEQLSDWVAGRLSEADTGQMETHVAGCPDCQSVASAMRALAGAGPDRGPILIESHVSSDEIVMFAQRDPSLDTTALAQIAAHVRGCPQCALECDLAEASLQERVSWTERLFGWLRNPETGGLSLGRMATAALIVLMAVPAYQGLTHGSSDGGGSQLLYLPAAQRGLDSAPTFQVSEDAEVTPFVLQYDLGLLEAGADALELRLLSGEKEVWTLTTSADRVWNPTLRAVSFLVPNQALAPGHYTLELADPENTLASSRFQILD